MNNVIQNFSKNEYLIIFGAFFYGHITTTFFSGWAFWIHNRKSISFSRDHVALSILVFLLMIDIWWVAYFRVNNITEGYLYFFLSLIPTINLFILTTTIFPSMKSPGTVDLTGYFKRRERLIYILLGLNFLINLVTAIVLEKEVDYSRENYFRAVAIALCLATILIQKRWFSRTLMIAGILLLLVHIVITPKPQIDSESSTFSFIGYLTVFTAFVYGFVASLFLRGWSLIIQRFSQISFSKEHFAWTLLAFCLLIDIWWGSWEREPYIAASLVNYVTFLSTPLVFCVLASALFPLMRNDSFDLTHYFNHNRKYIFLLFGCLMATNFLVANVMEENSLFSRVNILRLTVLLLTILVLSSKNILLHRVILIASWLLLIIHALL